jgi:hypothetical protein
MSQHNKSGKDSMNSDELAAHFDNEFGLTEWPKVYYVDAYTSASVCQAIFNWKVTEGFYAKRGTKEVFIEVAIGPHNGIVFKNVELILDANSAADIQ